MPATACLWLLAIEDEALHQAGVGGELQGLPGCPEMVVVPAGSFAMGSPESEPQRESYEGPQHRVTIAKPFAVGKFAVTFAGGCMRGGRRLRGYKPKDNGWGRGNRAAINVS